VEDHVARLSAVGNQPAPAGDDPPTPQLCECGCGRPAPISPYSSRRHGYIKGQPTRFVRGHATRGRQHSDVARKKISASLRGRKVSEETRKKISAAKRGWNPTPDQRKRNSAARLGKMVGREHPAWKGEAVGYGGLHSWVARHKTKTGVCEDCGSNVGTKRPSGTQWANISGEYRRDLGDFRELCARCHWHFDRGETPRPRRSVRLS